MIRYVLFALALAASIADARPRPRTTTTTTTTIAPAPAPAPAPSTFTVPAGFTVKPSTTVCDGVTDVTAKLQSEVNALAAYQALQLQAGTCVTSNNINSVGKNHTIIFGAGADATIIKALTPDKSAIIVTQSSSVTLAAMQVVSPNSTARLQIGNADCFYLFNGSNFTVDSVTCNRAAGAGIYFSKVAGGVIQNSLVQDTWADSFHVTGGSSNVTIQFNVSRNNPTTKGDDAYASIGYGSSGRNSNITIQDNEAYDGAWAGGIGIEGTNGAKVYRNKIYRSGIACIRVDSQSAYNTLGSDQIDLQDNYCEGNVTRTETAHGAIMLYVNYANAAGSYLHTVTGVRNQIVNPARGIGIRAYGYSATNDVQASFADTQMSGLATPFSIGSYASVTRTGTTLNGSPVP